MTSQSSTTNVKRAGFLPLFAFSTKQFWTTILLFTIILFFILPVPILMVVSGRDTLDAGAIESLRHDIAEDWTGAIRYFIVVIMSIFGVVVSCSRFKYLKNKVSVDFYHSLPVKRGQLFATQLGVGVLSLVIPYIVNILFTLIVIASNGLLSEALIVNLLIITAEVFIYTAFFFSLSTLVGMVSGLTAVQLTLTAVAIFFIPAAYFVSIAFIQIFNENMWVGFYSSPELLEKMSPVFRFLSNPDHLGIVEALIMLLVSAVLIAAAYVIYMHRKSERAGTPVVFAPLGEVIKYSMMFIGTLLGGLVFYYVMGSLIWMIFGIVCGMVLVFMLVNTILHKTARAMFKGWKGLGIFAACTLVIMTVLTTNAFGVNSSIPAPKSTSRVAVSFGTDLYEMEFTDKEVIEALYSIYTESKWSHENHRSGVVFRYDRINMNIVFYPHIGIPTAKEVYIYNKSDLAEEFRVILDSEEFKAQYTEAFEKLEDKEGNIGVYTYPYMFDENSNAAKPSQSRVAVGSELSATNAKEFGLYLVAEENEACGYDFFQQPAFGFVYAYTHDMRDSYGITLPLFGSMTELIDYYIEKGIMDYTPEEYTEKLADAIKQIEVYKHNDDTLTSMVVTDKAQMREILSNAVEPIGGRHSTYTFVETEYYAVYTVDTLETHELAFLLGRIPQFVTDTLG